MPAFQSILNDSAYSFLNQNEHLGKRIILLGVSGSYGYGTNRADSDIDLRGVALQRPSDLLGLTQFEQFADDHTDTVIYAFNKMVRLLLDCNPNSCEILGLPRTNYVFCSPFGEKLLKNHSLFLSKRAIKSFGGYADAQLRRLQNAIARDALPMEEREKHILISVQKALDDFNQRNSHRGAGAIQLYIDNADTPERDTEIFVDANYQHLPLRDYNGMTDTLRAVVRDYDRIGKRNHRKDKNHLNKHAMHLIRLLITGIDILEKQRIIVYRKGELPLLLKIRDGGFMQDDGTMDSQYWEILDMYKRKFREAAEKTTLPDHPDLDKVGAFVESVNYHAVTGEY